MFSYLKSQQYGYINSLREEFRDGDRENVKRQVLNKSHSYYGDKYPEHPRSSQNDPIPS